MIRLTLERDEFGELFICRSSFEERHIPRTAGFDWNPAKKCWYTSSLRHAVKLRSYAEGDAKLKINRSLIDVKPWHGRVSHPKQLKPYAFQLEAVLFALSRNRAYLALQPGLGKTICAALIWNALKLRTVYICPPFLAETVKEELMKWTDNSVLISVYPEPCCPLTGVWIIPDSALSDKLIGTAYVQLRAFAEGEHHAGRDSLLFVDEAHRYKSFNAERTRTLFGFDLPGLVQKFSRVIYLSGTPLPNRPIELFPVLSTSAPETIDFADERDFGVKYCAGFYDGFGWNLSGACNVEELARRVQEKFMLKITKEEALPELPPKTEELLFIGDALPPATAALEKKILSQHSPEDLLSGLAPNDEISTYRKNLGTFKVSATVEIVREILEGTEESILVFGIHREAIERLALRLANFTPLVITGSTPKDVRKKAVERFQNDSTRRLFIGNIQACGVGFTLTKATRVLFMEYSWVPAENDQAADRAHRIGQKDHVLVQYLVYRNSLDRRVLETILRKRKTTQLL